ncbi:MAG: hypothetical protein ACLS61_14100 [Ruminococcus sp.]
MKSRNKTGRQTITSMMLQSYMAKKTDYVIVIYSMANEYTSINGIKEIFQYSV